MYSYLDLSTANSGLGTPLRAGGQIINDNFLKLHMWMQSRSNIAAEAIPTIAAGGPPYVLAVEYSAGNPMPLTVYKRRGTAPTDTTNPGYVQSADGQWWEMVAADGEVFIEQFGGKGDFTGTPGTSTDNYTPTLKAIAFWERSDAAQSTITRIIRFGAKKYWFSQGFEVHATVLLRGRATSMEPGATTFYFPSTVTCFTLQTDHTTGLTGFSLPSVGEGNASILDGFEIRHHYVTGSFSHLVYSEAHGIYGRVYATLRNLQLTFIAGHAIVFKGAANAGAPREGQVNEFKISDCLVHSAGGHALWIADVDANAGYVAGFSSRTQVGGCGIKSENSFTNTFSGIHIAGYGNRGVHLAGRRYQLINGAGTTAPNTTTPGTNNAIWYDLGPGAAFVNFPDYNSSDDFSLYRLPIWDSGGANLYLGVYFELAPGGTIGHIIPPSFAVGGTLTLTSYSGWLYHDTNIGTVTLKGYSTRRMFASGSAEATNNGLTSGAGMGTDQAEFPFSDARGGVSVFNHWRDKDNSGAPYHFGYFNNELVYRQFNSNPIWRITTSSSTRTFGRSAPVNHVPAFYQFGLINLGDDNLARLQTLESARPTTGYHAAGEVVWCSNPGQFGAAAWVPSAAGTPGTLRTIPIFGLESIDPQNNGDFVVQNTSNTQVTFKYRGSDGVVRSANLTLS
jgi:hypothetical protein